MIKKIFTIFLLSFTILLISSPALAVENCSWMKSEIMKQKDGDLEYCPQNLKDGTLAGKCSGKMTVGQLCCCKTITPATTTAEPKFKLPDYIFQIPVGTLNKLTAIDCTNSDTCEIPWIAQYISAIYTYGLNTAGVIAVLILMAAGILWIVSGGDSGKIDQAKKMIFGSITGLLLIVSLNLLLNFINPDLIKEKSVILPSIQRIEIEPEQDADIEIVGGITPYKAGCTAAKKGDLTVCESLSATQPAGLINVTGIKSTVKVDSVVYQKYQAAIECVKKLHNGNPIFGINEAFRTALKQLEYKRLYPEKSATPCCSNHSSGQAMDINRLDRVSMTWEYDESSGLKACMNAQGLYARLTSNPNEPWHWSPTGR